VTIVRWAEVTADARSELLARPPRSRSRELVDRVRDIITEVRTGGDAAVRRLTRELDGADRSELEVSDAEKLAARARVTPAATRAIADASERVETFHRAQLPPPIRVETAPGVVCERKHVPIARVGLYVPAGSAPLVSTAIMLGVPARLAGCRVRVIATPPRPDGTVDPHVLAAAERLGITRVFACGGAQAIAALAYGTDSVAKVDKIFGPGNAWVTEAKLQEAGDPSGAASDLPAGPSEVLVIGDAHARADFVAADLLAQAEHGEDSQVVLVSDSRTLIEAVLGELARQIATLPRRAICEASLRHARFIETRDLAEAIDVSNAYAPEHLLLHVDDARALAERVEHAGSVFLGAWSPESAGDYASGTNHVLPTYGAARTHAGVSVDSFLKAITFQELTRAGARDLAPVVETLAELEGLEAHRRAMAIRRGDP
jgi:histidinol dehydrogenase